MPDSVSDTPTLLRPGPMPAEMTVTPAARLDRLSLRGSAGALGAAYGIVLPTAPCRFATAGARTALWLGPDEWLLLAPPGSLDADMTIEGGAVVDVSHRQIGLVLDGPGVTGVLAAGCPLDLHASAFPPGMCTRTIFGKVEIVLWRQDAHCFHMEVWRSLAAYVGELLRTAALDSGYLPGTPAGRRRTAEDETLLDT